MAVVLRFPTCDSGADDIGSIWRTGRSKSTASADRCTRKPYWRTVRLFGSQESTRMYNCDGCGAAIPLRRLSCEITLTAKRAAAPRRQWRPSRSRQAITRQNRLSGSPSDRYAEACDWKFCRVAMRRGLNRMILCVRGTLPLDIGSQGFFRRRGDCLGSRMLLMLDCGVARSRRRYRDQHEKNQSDQQFHVAFDKGERPTIHPVF